MTGCAVRVEAPLPCPSVRICVCAVVRLCHVARRHVEYRTVLLLLSWRVALPGRSQQFGYQEGAGVVKGATQGPEECALESVFARPCLWGRRRKIKFHGHAYLFSFLSCL